MSSSNKDARTIDWAVKLFRPVLVDLHIPALTDEIRIYTADYKEFQRYHMDRCLVIVKRFHFSKESYKGVFIWRYDATFDIFILYVIVADNLFEETSEESAVYRKAITTHEFTHCIAAILTSERLNDKNLIKRQSDKLKKRFHAIEQNDIKNLMTDISISMVNPNAARLLTFPDSHFRTEDEDFPPKYSELYRNMLLSYSLFSDYFNDDAKKRFKAFYDEGNREQAAKIISSVIIQISKEKCLDVNFVLTRFTTEFIPKLLKEI
ncbi:MAG: hypothetical protein IJP62_03390 [Treponema sp.]|nr:hypothetical protein [Treponema sp.]MBQ6780259.1 hypothetical protein [Treponema sp.]